MVWPFKTKSLQTVPSSRGGSWWTVLEPFTGAWQRNIEWKRGEVAAFYAIFACQTLIASDISKLQLRLVRDVNGIWKEIDYGSFTVLQKPNNYQNRIQFFESWLLSKLSRGNAYIYKERRDGLITQLHVLHPDRVMPLVSDNGEVFYQLFQDNLSGIQPTGVTVPASEIIHDRYNCLFHPLVGLPPIFACGLAAYQGLKIQENSARFFSNMSMPSGILIAPGNINSDTAARLKEDWQTNYSGDNAGRTAVLGDGMEYKPLSTSAADAQMVEQLNMTAEICCAAHHVPKYKVLGDAPNVSNTEALNQQYYDQCLQKYIEDIEICLDNGLGIPSGTGTEFDLDGLLRMDSTALYEANTKAVGGGWLKPDEARRRVNLAPVAGGDTPYLQQQNYALSALAKRDASDNPFAKSPPNQNSGGQKPQSENVNTAALAATFIKGLRYGT